MLVNALFSAGEAALSLNSARARLKNTTSNEFEKAFGALRLSRWFMIVYTGIMLVSLSDWELKAWAEAALSLCASAIMLLVCHLIPIKIARKHAKMLGRIFMPLGKALSFVLTPVLAPLNFLSEIAVRFFRADTSTQVWDVTEEDIRSLVNAGGEKGSIEEIETEMINNVFDFNNTIVVDVCVHRKDIFALPSSVGIDDIIRAAALERYTRIPVYSENIDNIIGILHIKDMFRIIMEGKGFDIGTVIHKPYFVPQSMTTNHLFNEMKKNKVHIAIVVDEYGGTAGLVTMEDLIEEIMGSIQDEYDEERPEIIHIAGNAYEVDGTTELDAVAEFFGEKLPADDYDTLGGFLIGQLGRVPSGDEQPEVEYGGLLFKIYKIFDRRISAVVVCDVRKIIKK